MALCKHNLSTFCYYCYTEKHGEPESFAEWSERVCSVRLATKEQRSEIYNQAEQWAQKTPARFGAARYDAKSAVAEYIANQQGLTLIIPSWRL